MRHVAPVVIGALAVVAVGFVSSQVAGSVLGAVALAYLIGLWACLAGCARWAPPTRLGRPHGRFRRLVGTAAFLVPFWALAFLGRASLFFATAVGFLLGAACFTVVGRTDRQLSEDEKGLADDLLG